MNTALNDFIAARDKVRRLGQKHKDNISFARGFLVRVLSSYLGYVSSPPVKPVDEPLAFQLGELAKELPADIASYLIGTTYTLMIPDDYRKRYGVYYTPPLVVERLLDQVEDAGIDWAEAKILDPACGGGAFLAPVVSRMAESLSELSAEQRLKKIEEQVVGIEIDPFSAWMSQALIEFVLLEDIRKVGRPLNALVRVEDSLEVDLTSLNKFDLVIGNPPYGRISLSPVARKKWERSLYGHANLYGLFSDLSVRVAKTNGVIALVTPTSFLGGQYFRALRKLFREEAPPVSIDFVSSRAGVFADVLQETLLAVYIKQPVERAVDISLITVEETSEIVVESIGESHLPPAQSLPWIFPRKASQAPFAEVGSSMTTTLETLGYTVSTGPLVWNRHKEQLSARQKKGVVPLIWAESVLSSGGVFDFRATGRNHVPWYEPKKGKDPNLVKQSCILLQRTTSLEQPRRLIAAELPQSFINASGGAVAVENHLNMIKAMDVKSVIPQRVIVALLNSETVDQVFRCISGSTAVSAYELKSMPLPSFDDCLQIDRVLSEGVDDLELETLIREMYLNVRP